MTTATRSSSVNLESSVRTMKSGHTATRADRCDPDEWQLPEITELSQNNVQGFATNDMSAIAHLRQRPRCTNDNTPAGDNDAASTGSRRPQHKTSSDGTGRSHPTNLLTSSSCFKSDEHMKCTLQNHERDQWTSHRSDQPPGDSTAWNIVDDETVETSRTRHSVRAMCGILRHAGSGTPDVDLHGTTRGHPAGITATGATRDEEQEEQCGELSEGPVFAWQRPNREATEEPRGRRHRPTAIIHRMQSRKEATRRCTTNDARSAGIGGSALH